MRHLPVRYRPDAIEDLKTIYRYVAAAGAGNAVAGGFVRRIMARCRKIGDIPNGGRPRDDLLLGLRTIPFEKTAVIAYVVTDAVEILNVFYGGRDFEALYQRHDDDKNGAPE